MNTFEDLFSSHSAAGLAPSWPMALFDHVGCGLLVCDAEGQLRYANRAAQHELASQRLLCVPAGNLRRTEGAAGDVAGALRLAAQRRRRSLVRLTRGGDQLMLSTVPLELPGSEPGLVLVMLGRRQACSELEIELLAGSYGLTLAERGVLAGLLRESKPSEIASERAVKLSTVRAQINSIRAKVGTRSVEGLLLRAAKMPPMAALVPGMPG